MITVIIPCFNTPPALLQETLQSLARTTYRAFEVILVDDGSSDKQFLSCLEPPPFSQHTHVITHTHNLGLSAARNSGAKHATTPYLLFLDSDDLIAPTAMEKWLWCLESYPEYTFVKGYTIGFGADNYQWEHGFHNGHDFLSNNQVNPTCLIRRDRFLELGGFDESTNGGLEDWDFWLKAANAGYWGGTIPEFLDYYRRRPNHGDRWGDFGNTERVVQYRAKLRQRYPKLWQGAFPKPVPIGTPNNTCAIQHPSTITTTANNRKHILLLLPWFVVGGADRFNLNLIQQLASLGWQVTIVANVEHTHPWFSEFEKLTSDIFILPRFIRPQDYPRFLVYLLQTRQTAIVLVSHSMFGYLIQPYLRTYYPQATYVDYNHMVVEALDGGFPHVAINSQPQLDLNIVSANQVRDWMTDHTADPARIAVCYINQDTRQWDPARFARAALAVAWQLPPNRPVLLYPARLEPQKRPKLLVDIILALRQKHPNFICLVAGDGPQRAWLLDAIRRHNLQNHLRFLGAIAPEKMQELYAVSDILLLPSQHEGISQAIYEAMAMAVVPVSALVGGQAELVVPGTGFLVPHSEQELSVYVQVLTHLLENPTERTQIGQAARQRIIDHFNLDQLGNRMIALFEQARTLAAQQPRQPLSRTEADALAARVVDDVKYERLQERLRLPNPLAPQPPDTGWLRLWRNIIFQLKKKVFRPCYYWALRHGFDGVVPLAERLYRSLNWLFR